MCGCTSRNPAETGLQAGHPAKSCRACPGWSGLLRAGHSLHAASCPIPRRHHAGAALMQQNLDWRSHRGRVYPRLVLSPGGTKALCVSGHRMPATLSAVSPALVRRCAPVGCDVAGYSGFDAARPVTVHAEAANVDSSESASKILWPRSACAVVWACRFRTTRSLSRCIGTGDQPATVAVYPRCYFPRATCRALLIGRGCNCRPNVYSMGRV
jgi:hypothetical protein